MRRLLSEATALLVAAGVMLPVVVGCRGQEAAPPAAGGPIQVVASIFPLADVARRIGRERVEVVMLLPPGETPHGFQPKPRDAEALAQTRLLLTVGLGLDLWADRAARASGNRRLTTLELYQAVKVTPIHVTTTGPHPEGERHVDDHTLGDPHLWLDPTIMQAYAKALADTLAQLDPAHAADFKTRQEEYGAALDRLDEDYRRTLATARIRSFVSFHSAFTYLAKRYGLKQEAVFEAERGDVGPRHYEEVVHFIKERGVKVLFAEPQYPPDRLQALARQTGTTVKTLDPEGNPNVPGHDSYLALMRTNLAALAEALECSNGPTATRPAP